ncbi:MULTISPECIES: SDR family NAD(P)-dependent oxidoreductase [unclassified Nesterenkonia]|uniref:SDR family NAD(P)-dependent oxidoreductase n=1 Tax=unclassified Nesterenkonia TaxID=2629769 RepID=UPI001F4C9A72|nr:MULTISPECIES: SDR family NAD(P)-dependent oxidoreductase [unclassified Nesterenkonia]MCH8560688.1 SDR family NAD(P)-dependent oxidoreductase [Nesterenkonia sp. DZ6]MCH8570796.1 SDR family NAD(P)-dependent oxidoreductase [Nesterenkonia sp. AY15]
MELTRASAIVSGGASGLGHATAKALIMAGAQVVVVDLPDAEGSTERADAVSSLGGRAAFCPGDITDPATSREAVAAAAGRGPLRVAVSCAGVATPGKLLGRDGPLSQEQFMGVLAVNVGGTVNLMAQVAAAMRDNEPSAGERGVLINTASVAAFEGQIGQIAYAASKGAVASLTLPAARELARHAIRVMTIAPGLFETPMMAGLPEEAKESLRAKTLHPARLGAPEDYAQLVMQIVANPMLNGETIRLDGAIRLEPR